MMNTINVIIAMKKMKKSWGQKILLNQMNLPSTIFSIRNGSPLTLIKGKEKNTMK